MRPLPIILILAAALIASKIPLDSREAHRRADLILLPRSVAAFNEYSLNHGQPSDPGHLDKIDAKDKKRFDELWKAIKEWHDAMKQAGY